MLARKNWVTLFLQLLIFGALLAEDFCGYDSTMIPMPPPYVALKGLWVDE